MPDLILIDTNILIWGVQKKARPGYEEMIAKADRYFQTVPKETTFIISSIVLGEFLRQFPEKDALSYSFEICSKMHVVPFDVASALKSNRIFREQFPKFKGKYRHSNLNDDSRIALLADINIIASGLVHGATKVVSEDALFLDMARPYFPVVMRLPETPPTQPDLPIPS